VIWLLVALGGATGSVLRYGVGQLALRYLGTSSVMGTFAVNVSGSFILGFFLILALEKWAIPVELRAMIAVGLLGGYTTFSTLAFESVRLLESGELVRAGISLGGNLVLGLVAAYLGILLARAV
jgi:CrcB protein